MFYNFARIHQTLLVTLAMDAGVSDHAGMTEEIALLVMQNKMPVSDGTGD